MAPKAHSDFSASSAARLLACPAAYQLGREFAPAGRQSSVFAAEGTLAHSLSEACLFSNRDLSDYNGDTFTVEGFDFTVDEDFADAAQVYVDYGRSLRGLGYTITLEQQVSPTGLFALHSAALEVDLYGTADLTGLHVKNKHIVMGDLKFGRGIAVEAQDNPQLLYYAAGVVSQLIDIVEPDWRVTLVVVQPRAPHVDGTIRTAEYTVEQVVRWANTVLYPGVANALTDNGKTMVPGSHCRFCAALPNCTGARQASVDTARQLFADTPMENIPAAPIKAKTDFVTAPVKGMSDDELGSLLDRIEIVSGWTDAVKREAQTRIDAGNTIPGWKMVPTRPRRTWGGNTDAEVDAALTTAGVDPTKYKAEVIRTPAQVEKAVGKKVYRDSVEALVGKESSGVKLAPDTDPRTRVGRRSARDAFSPLDPAKGN